MASLQLTKIELELVSQHSDNEHSELSLCNTASFIHEQKRMLRNKESTLLVDFEARKLAHIIVKVRQTTRGLKRDPRRRLVAGPLYQKRVVLRWNSSDVVDWQCRGINVVITSLQAMSQDAIDGKFETISFSHTLQTLH